MINKRMLIRLRRAIYIKDTTLFKMLAAFNSFEVKGTKNVMNINKRFELKKSEERKNVLEKRKSGSLGTTGVEGHKSGGSPAL